MKTCSETQAKFLWLQWPKPAGFWENKGKDDIPLTKWEGSCRFQDFDTNFWIFFWSTFQGPRCTAKCSVSWKRWLFTRKLFDLPSAMGRNFRHFAAQGGTFLVFSAVEHVPSTGDVSKFIGQNGTRCATFPFFQLTFGIGKWLCFYIKIIEINGVYTRVSGWVISAAQRKNDQVPRTGLRLPHLSFEVEEKDWSPSKKKENLDFDGEKHRMNSFRRENEPNIEDWLWLIMFNRNNKTWYYESQQLQCGLWTCSIGGIPTGAVSSLRQSLGICLPEDGPSCAVKWGGRMSQKSWHPKVERFA